jgi:glucokinase
MSECGAIMPSSLLAVGIDLGATTARLGLVTPNGTVVTADRFPTEATRGATGVLRRLAEHVEALIERAGVPRAAIVGLGIGCPAAVDPDVGVVRYSVNLHWQDVGVGSALQESLGIPVFVQQDAAAAALGERWLGSAKHADDVVLLSVGTGIGAGILIRGRPHLGLHGLAGGIGHICVDEEGPLCGCGRRGCLEAVAAGPAIARAGRDAALHGAGGMLVERARRGEDVTAYVVVEAARAGDPLARAVLDTCGRYLGQAIALLAAVLAPQVIVIGGGLVAAGECLLDPARAEFRRAALEAVRAVPILESRLRESAGVVGAASLVWTARLTGAQPRVL